MKLLLFSFTKHQYKYFSLFKQNLPFESTHIFMPTLNLSFLGLFFIKKLDLQNIFELKFKEIETKSHNKFKNNLYKLFLKIQAPLVVSSAYKHIKNSNTDFIMLWNGKKFHQAIVVEVAKQFNTRCVYFENGVLPNTTTMDFKGVNATNSVPREIGFYKDLVFDKAQVLPNTLVARESQNKSQVVDTTLPKHYIFVPFQVGYDTQLIHHSPWIKDMYELFSIVSWLANNSGIDFVIKEHPSDRINDYSKLYLNGNRRIVFSNENTQNLIQNSDAVLTINSSVGIESLLFHKKVIVLGKAFFAIDGIVKVAANKNEILNILEEIEQWQLDVALIDNFLKYLKYDYLVPTSWRNPDENHFMTIKEKLEMELENVK